mmetsp:Transcript_8851/g.16159  ORF Transcript_8851/g.16159 Transcript_8851/m.16159 type:complete len:177 (-) Transcript_8851:4-534(-)
MGNDIKCKACCVPDHCYLEGERPGREATTEQYNEGTTGGSDYDKFAWRPGRDNPFADGAVPALSPDKTVSPGSMSELGTREFDSARGPAQASSLIGSDSPEDFEASKARLSEATEHYPSEDDSDLEANRKAKEEAASKEPPPVMDLEAEMEGYTSMPFSGGNHSTTVRAEAAKDVG